MDLYLCVWLFFFPILLKNVFLIRIKIPAYLKKNSASFLLSLKRNVGENFIGSLN